MLNYTGKIGKIDLGENNKGKTWEIKNEKTGEEKNGLYGTVEFFNPETFKIESVKLNFELGQDFTSLKVGDVVSIPVSRSFNANKKMIDLKQVRELKLSK
jgi:hypothetical protein